MASVTEMPYADPEQKRAAARTFEAKRRAATLRLRIAIETMREYGCLWAYEQACRDEGIEEPLLVPNGREESRV